MNEWRIGGMIVTGKTGTHREKPVTMPLHPPQFHMHWPVTTQAGVVRGKH
jgi:hypothetical protein